MKIKYPEARVALCKCKEFRKVFGIRMERTPVGWDRTWAYPIKKFEEDSNGDEKTMEGMIGTKESYPGCPYCGTFGLVVCGECGRLNCNSGIRENFKCEWCGFTGDIVSEENNHGDRRRGDDTDMQSHGFSFKSGKDR